MTIEKNHDQFPRKYVAGPGFESGTFDSSVRRAICLLAHLQENCITLRCNQSF